MKFYILYFAVSSLLSALTFNDMTSLKVHKLIEKEELIAKAYKIYLAQYGKEPTYEELKSNNSILWHNDNFWGTNVAIDTRRIYSSLPDLEAYRTTLYSSLEYREHTTSDGVDRNGKRSVGIIFNDKEQFILDNQDIISTSIESDKYHLDESGVLHWYDSSAKYVFSYDKNIIVAEEQAMGDKLMKLLQTKKVLTLGMSVFHVQKKKDAIEYLYLSKPDLKKYGFFRAKDSPDANSDTPRGAIRPFTRFNKNSGGALIDGDIYTWGNNSGNILSIAIPANIDISVHIPLKTRVESSNEILMNQKIFSSIFRPSFVDFFSSVKHGVCGVSIKGGLYCNSNMANAYGYSEVKKFFHANFIDLGILYKSDFFDGIKHKANKALASDKLWVVLGDANRLNDATLKYGKLFTWGLDNRGLRGIGVKNTNYMGIESNNDTVINKYYLPKETIVTNHRIKIGFKDIVLSSQEGIGRILALSDDGDLYFWGTGSSDKICSSKIKNVSINLCRPIKIQTDRKFIEILNAQSSFLLKDEYGGYLSLSFEQTSTDIKLNFKILMESSVVKNKGVMSLDISSKLENGTLLEDKGFVWVDSDNNLKGDYFTSATTNDSLFKSIVAGIKWKRIRVVSEDNTMCGIAIDDRMYCWGKVIVNNMPIIPIFNTNLYKPEKDYIVSSKGNALGMLNGESHFVKYPTYIGGFDYNFIMK